MNSNIIVSLFGLAFGAVVFVLLPTHAGRDGYAAIGNIQSAAFFPLLLSILLIGISVVFLMMTLITGGRAAEADSASVQDEAGSQPIEAPLRLAATAASLVVYYLLIGWTGMLAASVVLIVGLSLILGFRRYVILAAVAGLLPLGLHILFQRMLYVLLPGGQLF
jgi:hypothetical protein